MNRKSIFDFISDFITGIMYFFDRPPAAKADVAKIGEDAGHTALGVLSNDRDPDWGDALHVASVRGNLKGVASVSADGKHINYNPGNAFQYLGAGQTATEIIKYTVADRLGKTSESIVTVTIVGSNDAAVLSSDTRNLTEADTAAAISTSGTLSITDVDSPAKFVAQSGKAGAYGHFSINSAGAWTYVADTAHDEFKAGTVYTDKVIVSSVDGTKTSVTINLTGTNDAAVLSSQTVNLTEGDTAAAISATGALTIADVDSPAVFVAQSNVAGAYGHFSIDGAGAWSYVADSAHDEFAAGTTYTDAFAVTSADGTATSVTVNITGAGEAGGSARNLTYLVKIDGIDGTSNLQGYTDYIEVDAFTFGALTSLSGGGGGGAGRAVFDPLMIDLDGLSPGLAELLQNAATGRRIETVDLVGLNSTDGRTDEIYHLKLDDATVSGVAIDGDDTAVAFGYNKVSETIREQNPDGSLGAGQTFEFDLGREGGSTNPVDHDALAAMAHEDEDPALTYLVKIDGNDGTSNLDGYTDYLEVDGFTFGALTSLSSGGGGGAGRAMFDPLMIDLDGLSPGLAELLQNAATGRRIETVDLVGLKTTDGRTDEIYHLKLDDATVSGVAIDGDDTAVAFGYNKVSETIREQNPDGSLGAGQTFEFDLGREGGSTNPIDHHALAAMAHEDEDPALTFLVKIDGIDGTSNLDGYTDYIEVDAFTFGALTSLSGGGGAGRAVFDPLMIDLDGLSPGLAELLQNAATGRRIETVDLVGLKTTDGRTDEIYHLKLDDATVSGVAIDGDDTAVAFGYNKVSETIRGQNPDGSLGAGQTFEFDLGREGGSTNPVDQDALAAMAHEDEDPGLTYLVKIDGIDGTSNLQGYTDYLEVDGFTFGALTSLSGGGGGGAGRAVFDPLMIDLDGLSPGLAELLQNAATGRRIETVDLVGLKTTDGRTDEIYHLKLDDATVSGVAIDGDDTAVAFGYNTVSETIREQNPDGSLGAGQTFEFDLGREGGSTNPVDHDALAAMAHEEEDPTLTYLVKIDGIDGTSNLDGYTDYLEVDGFTFGALTSLSGGGGGGAGRAVFDPLMIDLDGLSPGLAELLQNAATGRRIETVDLVGLKTTDGRTDEIYHLMLDDATVSGVAIDGDDTAVAFGYNKVSETIREQNPDGSLGAGQTFEFDLGREGGSTNPVDHDALAAMAHEAEDPALTYLVKIDGIDGTSNLDGYTGYLEVDAFTFGEMTAIAGSGGGGAGRATFDPLMIDIDGLSPGLAELLGNAASGRQIQTVDLVGLKITDGHADEIYHLKLDDATVSGVAIDGDDTAFAFGFNKISETIREQNPDGSLGAGQTFEFDLRREGGAIAPVDHDALAAMAHAHDLLLV